MWERFAWFGPETFQLYSTLLIKFVLDFNKKSKRTWLHSAQHNVIRHEYLDVEHGKLQALGQENEGTNVWFHR